MTVEGRAVVPAATVLGISSAAALVPLNSTMIAVALPSIAAAFDISTARVSVLVIVYLICMLIGQPIAGRISDAVGSWRTIGVALVGLAAFSALASVANSFELLVAARVFQALCAAALSPSAQSLLRTAAGPDEQGRVFGIFGSAMGVGSAVGPVVGGVMVALFGWRAVFLINVPIALAAAAASRTITERRPTEKAEQVVGDDRIANRTFVAGFSTQALSTQAQYALILLTPIILNARGWGAGSIGLILSAMTLGIIVASPRGGRAGDLVGRRTPVTAGLMVAAVAVAVLAIAGREVEPVLLVVAVAIFGLGFGVAVPNITSASLSSVPEHRTGAAAGIFTMSRYVGSISTTVLLAVLVTDDARGSSALLTTSVVCMALAIGVSRWLPAKGTLAEG